MSSSEAPKGGLWHKFREFPHRFRSKSRNPPRSADAHVDKATPRSLDPGDLDAILKHTTSATSSITLSQSRDAPEQSATARDDETQLISYEVPKQQTAAGVDEAQLDADQDTANPVACMSGLDQETLVTSSIPDVDVELSVVTSDMWTSAYSEALNSLEEDVKAVILQGKTAAELFSELDQLDKTASQESAIMKGVQHLKRLQVPLERLKLALDWATPLTSIEPITATVFGVVKGVTAIAIAFSTADVEFGKQIGQMLEHLSYIDDCDTLSQKTNKNDIHRALVKVYRKLLEFYNTASGILRKRGPKVVFAIIREQGNIPEIVKSFLEDAGGLQRLISNATLDIVTDIQKMLQDTKIDSWLESSKRTAQNQHHDGFRGICVDEACEFLVTDAKFINWYHATDSQQLVVLGQMGSGKTITMAFLINKLSRRVEHELPQPKLCFHYCRNDETGNSLYILKSLILSVLQQIPDLKRSFFEWYERLEASGFPPRTSYPTLEGWLGNALATLHRPVFFVIDGLDECDKDSWNVILKSLMDLSRKTPRLKVLLSSRPQEEILEQLNGMTTIDMPIDDKRDRLIVEKMVETRLSTMSTELKELVIERLSYKAQGSAIWTKMTIELLAKRNFRARRPLETFLEQTPQPQQLSQLYVDLFSKYTEEDPENQTLVNKALHILAVTRRPLSILELGWAVALGTAQGTVTTVNDLANLEDHGRLLNMLTPFIPRLNYDDKKKRQVKLVHQSVKEFIIAQWAASRPCREVTAISALGTTDSTTIQQCIESLEADLLNICIGYLLLQDINDIPLFSADFLRFQELTQADDLFADSKEPNNYDHYCSWETWEETMIKYDPTERGFGELFVYASSQWTELFGSISSQSLFPRLDSIENLCQAGSIRLENWAEQNCRPDCAVKARFEFDSSEFDPLGVTSLYGSKAILEHMLENSDFDQGSFLPDSAMKAASQILQDPYGDVPRLGLLWGSKLGHQLRNMQYFCLVIRQYSARPYDKLRQGWDVVCDSLDDVLDMMVKEQWGGELLDLAVMHGCMPIIKRLTQRAKYNPALRAELLQKDQSEHRWIREAVLGNHVDVIEHLLAQEGIEPHLHHRDSQGQNVLHLAGRFCNPVVFRLLLPHLRDHVQQKDDADETVLENVIRCPAEGRYESARILLSEVAGTEHDFSWEQRQKASLIRSRDSTMCSLLLSFKVPASQQG